MPFDALTMAAVSDELRAHAVGSRIQKIIQPSPWAVALSAYGEGRQRWILLSADPRFARVAFAEERLAKAFPTPSPFIMLLRKHLDGARILDVTQMPHERILVLGTQRGRLVAEVMGKHSNIILVTGDDKILGALKLVPPRESRVRPILPGQQYQPPPPRSRDPDIYTAGPLVDPYLEPGEFAALLESTEPSVTVRAALMGALAGCGPFLADEIAARAHVLSRSSLMREYVPRLLSAGRDVYRLYQTREWEPVTFRSTRGTPDFAPYMPRSVEDPQPAASMSAAIERAVAGLESRDSLQSSRTAVRQRLSRALAAAERRVDSLRHGLEASEDAEKTMEAGQLLLTYQHLVKEGSSQLEVPDTDVVISLDPHMSAVENAERHFRRYRKLRDARRRIPPLLADAQAEVDRLGDIEAFVALAETEADLQVIRRELEPSPGRAPKQDRSPKQGRSPQRSGPRRYAWQGYTAIVGRTARENEEVTFHLASRTDLWLHARDRSGAHVILRGPADPAPEVLRGAAALAAFYSSGRADTAVDVDVASARDVRKVPGGPPGKVTYRNFRTLRATPSIGEWQPA